MQTNNVVLFSLIMLLYSGGCIKNKAIDEKVAPDYTYSLDLSYQIPFDSVKNKYDTLIPIFNGLFITYNKLDSSYLTYHQKEIYSDTLFVVFFGAHTNADTEKWGVIDSADNVIVPFICDGVKTISDTTGVISIFSTSFSLNTGIPRYQYIGNYYYFNREGVMKETKKEFSIKIEYLADWHNAEYVIQQGPEFYLPAEYRINNW